MTRLVWTLLVCFSFLVGCGPPEGQRPTAPVEVTVTYQGKPVDGATVTFITSVEPMAANGITDAKGIAHLSTYGVKDGAVIGSNLITITKTEVDKSIKKKEIPPDQADVVGFTPLTPLKSFLPKKYAMPGSSGLTGEVKSGQNKFSFDLKD